MVIRHDTNDADYLDYGSHFRNICCLNTDQQAKGVGTLIHPYWVLTAAHAAKTLPLKHEIVCADKSYPIREITYHPSWLTNTARPSRDIIQNLADLALIELDKPVQDVAPTKLVKNDIAVGDEMTFVGKGAFGDGLTGVQGWDNQWRAATNRVEEVVYEQWLVFRFDEPDKATKLEGVGGLGDSGGPALIEQEGEWRLTGIGSWEEAGTATGRGKYGVLKYFVYVPPYADWISQVTGL